MCHDKPDSSALLREKLSEAFAVTLFDSGSEKCPPKNPDVVFPNLYWTGCWNQAIHCFPDCDALWVIGGDVSLVEPAHVYRESIESAMPFGCWSPAIKGRCRPLMSVDHVMGRPWSVWHLEGVAMAVSRQLINVIDRLPSINKFGWGLDIWLCWRSWTAQMRNVLDGRVTLVHPEHCGYDGGAAMREMGEFLKSEIGPRWRDELRYWSDDFDPNVRGPLKRVQ